MTGPSRVVHLFERRQSQEPGVVPEDNLAGQRNANPKGMSLPQLWAEDFRTHGRSFLQPGFWAVSVHRFGNWRMSVRPGLLRAPLSVVYKALHTGISWLWGIDLEYSVVLGRRVRLWHHGGMMLGARSIGDDVHIRHNTTLGVLHRDEPSKKPIIGNRADIGAGACVLGDVLVGDDTIVGANSVVVRNFPPGSTLFGVPARPVGMRPGAVSPVPDHNE